MHRIDGQNANPDGTFRDRNLAAGVRGTFLTAKWLNAVFGELANLCDRAGIVLDPLDSAQVLAALQVLYGSGVSSGALRNRLINGDFRLWQRGLSLSTTNAEKYSSDRWVARADALNVGTGTATLTRQAFAPGQTDVPGAEYYLRWVQGTAATNGTAALIQRIERRELFDTVKVALSLSARASTAITAAARLTQSFGTGGSADVTVGNQSLAITTAWTRFAYVFDVPSQAGKTLGTNPNFRIAFNLPVGSTYTFEIADVQLEIADQATSFDRRPLGIEWLLALRYFATSYPHGVTPGTDGGVPANARNGMGWGHGANTGETGSLSTGEEYYYGIGKRLPVPMRISPTVTWYRPGTGSASGKLSRFDNSPETEIAVAATLATTDGHTGFPQSGANSTSGQSYIPAGAHWTADAEL